MRQPLSEKQSGNFLEVKYTLTYDSPILLLGINPRDVKAMSNTKTHTWVFVVPN